MVDDDKVLAEAKQLCRRGLISGDEKNVMRHAARILLKRDAPMAPSDFQILRFARGVWGHDLDEPTAPVTTPYDDEVLELERQVEEAKAAHENATEALYAAGREWATLTGQGGYVADGIMMVGLLHGVHGVRNQTGIPFLPLEAPPDSAAVAAAEERIQYAREERGKTEKVWTRVNARLSNVRRAQSNWRMTQRNGK